MTEVLFFKTSLFVMVMVYGLIRIPFMKQCKANKNVKAEKKTLEKTKVFIAWLGMVLTPMLFVFTNLFNRFDIHLNIYLRLIGLIGLILSAVFFYRIHKELSDNWSPILEIKENQKLIKTGIYKTIRHPMYTQSWLWVFFAGIAASNWFVLIFGIITWGTLYFSRVFDEEKMMIDQFQDEYVDYMKQTGRLFPKIKFNY